MNRIIKNIKILLGLTFAIIWVNCGSSNGPEEPENLKLGWQRFQNADYDSALTLFNKALKNKKTTEGRVGKGWSLLMLDTSLTEVESNLEYGISDTAWESNARVGLASVKLSQGKYTQALNHSNIVLNDNSSYVFQYNSNIDWHDLIVIKSQALFLGKRNYIEAYNTIEKIEPDSSYHLNPEDPKTWQLQGEKFDSFNNILAEIIAEESKKYKSF